ncbi:hypothetical protein TIFTF001_036058 [Ficus carica]|uniref:Secreted protein n=1 Tax=Ficus carica TaxID=3494 RepID=A0AA88JAQ6_FICCA|nr:hypothetical protein TIFTF001_036058 [Ficus carica]
MLTPPFSLILFLSTLPPFSLMPLPFSLASNLHRPRLHHSLSFMPLPLCLLPPLAAATPPSNLFLETHPPPPTQLPATRTHARVLSDC